MPSTIISSALLVKSLDFKERVEDCIKVINARFPSRVKRTLSWILVGYLGALLSAASIFEVPLPQHPGKGTVI